jgi:hypothetical protein
MLLVLILLQFRVLSSFAESASGIRVLSSFAESAFYPHLRNPLTESAFYSHLRNPHIRNPRFILICGIRLRNPHFGSAFYPNPPVSCIIVVLSIHLLRCISVSKPCVRGGASEGLCVVYYSCLLFKWSWKSPTLYQHKGL